MMFEGRIALVTGASSGMGAATARLLADRGARVFTAQRGREIYRPIFFAPPLGWVGDFMQIKFPP